MAVWVCLPVPDGGRTERKTPKQGVGHYDEGCASERAMGPWQHPPARDRQSQAARSVQSGNSATAAYCTPPRPTRIIGVAGIHALRAGWLAAVGGWAGTAALSPKQPKVTAPWVVISLLPLFLSYVLILIHLIKQPPVRLLSTPPHPPFHTPFLSPIQSRAGNGIPHPPTPVLARSLSAPHRTATVRRLIRVCAHASPWSRLYLLVSPHHHPTPPLRSLPADGTMLVHSTPAPQHSLSLTPSRGPLHALADGRTSGKDVSRSRSRRSLPSVSPSNPLYAQAPCTYRPQEGGALVWALVCVTGGVCMTRTNTAMSLNTVSESTLFPPPS